MAYSVHVEFPLPDTNVLSHATRENKRRQFLTKRMRRMAYGACVAHPPKKMMKAIVRYSFYFPDLRIRDEVNYMHGCKPYVDGLVDWGLVPDDNWRVLSTGATTSELDRDNPRVVITFTERES